MDLDVGYVEEYKCGVSRGERFTDVDGSIIKADELEDIPHSRRKVL